MQSKQVVKWVNIAVVLFLMFGFGYVVEPFSTVTETGVKILGAFLGMVYGWCTLGMAWPSLLCMVAIAMSGLYSMAEVSAQAFGNYLLFFLIVMMIIIENLSHCGFTTNLAKWLISRKFCSGHPWRLLMVIFLTTYLLGGFSQAFATIFLMWELWYNIFQVVGYKPYEKFTTAVLTGTILAVVLGSLTMPFHQLPLIFLTAFGNALGEPAANYATYIAVVVPFTLVLLAEWILMLRYVFKLDISKLKNFAVDTLVKGDEIKFTKHQMACAGVLGILIVALIIPGVCPHDWGLVKFLNAWGPLGSALVAMVVMMWLRIEGKPVLDLTAVAKKAVNWDVIFFFAMVMFISTCLTNQATGISPFVVAMVTPLVASKGAIGFCMIVLIVGTIVTNFFNNTVTGMLLMQLVVAFAATLTAAGISPWAMLILLLISVNMAFWTPVACPTASLLYANETWVKKMDVFKVIFPTSIVWIISIYVICWPWANFLF